MVNLSFRNKLEMFQWRHSSYFLSLTTKKSWSLTTVSLKMLVSANSKSNIQKKLSPPQNTLLQQHDNIFHNSMTTSSTTTWQHLPQQHDNIFYNNMTISSTTTWQHLPQQHELSAAWYLWYYCNKKHPGALAQSCYIGFLIVKFHKNTRTTSALEIFSVSCRDAVCPINSVADVFRQFFWNFQKQHSKNECCLGLQKCWQPTCWYVFFHEIQQLMQSFNPLMLSFTLPSKISSNEILQIHLRIISLLTCNSRGVKP